jgi:predicted TIM-barrel fold metal-dependent hydrolase
LTINDSHCHFFSIRFFAALARQRSISTTAADICRELSWEPPGTPEALADRWVAELDAKGVARSAIIASVPGDEESVGVAAARHPSRLVAWCMVDPSSDESVHRVRRAVTELGVRAICLLPAMHHVPLGDDRTMRVIDAALGEHAGVAVFVHCGVLTVGVRARLNLPSRLDLQLGDPLGVSRLAMAFPSTPFVIPHFGAGRLREALMAADVCKNVYLDTSSSNSWIKYTPGLTFRDVFAAALAVAGPERLLFGTDSSFFPRGWNRPVYEQQQATASELGVSVVDQALIFGGNFERLFPRTA